VYADDVNIFGGNIDTIIKNKQVLLDDSKKNSLKANRQKTK